MAAAYDTYDYPSYWLGRDYEHESEIVALKEFLTKIPNINRVLEIGTGYGRISTVFLHRAKNIILTDPSQKLLKIARKNIKSKKVRFIHTKLENLPGKVRSNSIDLVVMVRVLHHIENVDVTFELIKKIIKPNGFFILEFANKQHFKETVKQFIKGNFTFPLEIFPTDKSSKESQKKCCLPFMNYHPDILLDKLERMGFEIVNKRSVSNIRSPFLKKTLPLELLLTLEKLLQKPLSYISFGPSIFVLLRKRG